MACPSSEFLVDGKYRFVDLVDIDDLRRVFARFTEATGFTIGLLDHPDLNILISAGWRTICTRYHRANATAAANCHLSNRRLFDHLDEPNKICLEECANGLVDCAFPIIVNGKHIANLTTGQLLLAPPDLEFFRKQARDFGFDEVEYLRALAEVPVVPEHTLRAITLFLGDMARILSQLGLARLSLENEKAHLEEEATRRRKIAAELLESEQKYHLLIETTQTGFVILDDQGRVLDANQEYVRLTGRTSLDEIRGRPVTDWTAPHDLERNALEVKNCLETGLVRNLEINYVDLNGRMTPIEIHASVLPTPKSKRIVTICRDISTRKQADTALRESENRLRTIFELSPISMAIVALDGTIEYINRRAIETFGYLPSDIPTMDRWWAQAYPDADYRREVVETWTGLTLRAIAEHRDIEGREYRVTCKNGDVKTMYIFGVPAAQKVFVMFDDITERKKAEVALRESEERHRATLASMSDLVFGLDKENRFVDYHTPASSRLYRPAHEFLGRKTEEVLPPEIAAALAAEIELARRGDDHRRMDYEMDLGGRRTHWSANITTRRDASGSYDGVTIVTRDVTQQKAMEDRLRQSEKMEAIGKLAGGIAHDFNNQLTGVLGYTHLLLARLEDPQLREFAAHIRDAALRSAELTRQLLAFGRKGKVLTTATDIHAIIAGVIELLRRTIDKRIEISSRLDAPTAIILGDTTQLQGALLNLGLNARDAMPQGGTLLFATGIAPVVEPQPGEEAGPGPHLFVSVSDTGIGMSAETQRRLFEPFFTTKPKGKGTGLGLASVYGTVKAHSGLIRVISEPNRGSTFTLFLPLPAEPIQLPATEPPAEPQHQATSGRILLVDDEPTVIGGCSAILRAQGYEVTACLDPVEALEQYKRCWQTIDLIILDMIMPRLSGRDLFTAMRRINPQARVLVCSGYSLDGDAQTVLDAGAIGFIAKPFVVDELTRRVSEALAETSR